MEPNKPVPTPVSTPGSSSSSSTAATASTSTGIKKPSGIPSATGISRLPTTLKKSGIPPPTQTTARATTPTNVTPTATSSGLTNDNQPKAVLSNLPSFRSSISLPKDQSSSSLNTEQQQENRRESTSQETSGGDEKQTAQLRNTIKDLNEKLETLKLKRAEDREKLREFEKLKLQNQQLQDFKEKAQEKISDLNKELQTSKQEAKTYKDQYESYKEEMANHEEALENMTVEKELAEETAEQYKYEITQLKDKCDELTLELDVIKSEIALNGDASSYLPIQQDKEKERLQAALIKLRDLSHQDKSEINNLRKQLEEISTKSAQLSKENDRLKTEFNANQIQINELNAQVTATMGSVQIIESLTEKNLDLETKIVTLEETIADLEEMNEVNDQILEGIREEEKELRQNLDMTESRIREHEREIESLKYKIADHEKTIIKFRGLVQQQQSEKDDLNKRCQIKIDQLQSELSKLVATGLASSSPGNFDFQKKLVESKNFAKMIENELNKIEIQNLKKYTNYLLTFMSDQFLKRSGDHECILMLLFFKRLINKADLILNQVKEKYSQYFDSADLRSINGDHPEFVFEISMILTHLKLLCNKYDYILNTCGPKTFLNMGSMFFDFNSHEKVIDMMTDLLQKDQLDENRKNLELAEKMCVHLQSIYKNHLPEEKFDEIQFLDDLVRLGTFGCDSITVYLQNINSIVHAKEDQTEIMQLLRELSCNNEELKIFLKKAIKRIPRDDNSDKKIILNLPEDLQKQLENCINNFYMVCKTLKELNYLATNSHTFMVNETTETNLTAKKLEDLAYQACDKVYLIDDNGPYENLRNSINELHQTFLTTIAGLETGEYEKTLTDEEWKIRKYMVNSPILVASEQFKNALIEAESIKFKLETKEDEIKEIKRNLKVKVDELSEYKLRINLNENKSENALKEAEEKSKKLSQSIDELKANFIKKEEEHIKTIEVMQQEIETHENEIRELKKKIPKKAGPESPGVQAILKPNVTLTDSPFLIQEIKVAKTLNKLLEKNNNELKKHLTENMLNNLMPLPKVKRILPKLESSSNLEAISKLNKQSKDLMKEVYESLANVKVNELKPAKSEENKKFQNKEKLHYNLICQTANQIQKKIFELQTQLTTKSNHPVNLVKRVSVNQEKNLEKKYVGEIVLPCGPNKARVIDMNVSYDELKELLRYI